MSTNLMFSDGEERKLAQTGVAGRTIYPTKQCKIGGVKILEGLAVVHNTQWLSHGPDSRGLGALAIAFNMFICLAKFFEPRGQNIQTYFLRIIISIHS